MTIGVLQEAAPETRVSLLPEHVAALKKKGIAVLVQSEAGKRAFASDEAYIAAGAKIVSKFEVLSLSDIILSMHLHHDAEWKKKVFIGNYQPLFNHQKMQELATHNCSVFSLDMLPRTTRGQAMDILSSQANIAGYKAVLMAAQLLPKYFPMLMTAAGSIKPAKVLILGAGVAGLQAIATAKRLGAVVEVFDTRPAVKEEVQSLGAKFIEVEGAADASTAGGYAVEQSEDFKQRQKQRIADSAAKADVIISTASIPGKKAPILITKEMIYSMNAGSVIIDLAASTGGNTEVTENNTTVVYHFVSIVGDSNLAATAPSDASKLYGKNVLNFLELLTNKEGQLYFNFDDDLVKGCCITHEGKVTNERVAGLVHS
ncbi:Re/Si-specific NAD(P)(+) transhydrogenase subunit alpha [soil metagenome]